MHTFLCLFPPTGRHIYVCSGCSLCSLDFLCLPYKENSPSWYPNHVNNIKDNILLNPTNKPSDSVSSLSAPPSPPPLLLCLLLFHCLNMTGAPRSLSKAGDRWNWWALQVQHETSGQAWVIGATNSVVRAAASLHAVGPALLIRLMSLTLGFQLHLWVYHQMLDLMIKILSLVVELSDVKKAKLTGCLSPLWTKHNAHWCAGWK